MRRNEEGENNWRKVQKEESCEVRDQSQKQYPIGKNLHILQPIQSEL